MYITQGLKRAVQINGGGMATIDGAREHTWAQFTERVAKLAGALKHLGLTEGGRVAILSLNSDRYLEYFFGVPWAGGVVVPLNIRLAPPELIYMLNDSGTEILIVDDVFKAMLPAFQGQLNTVRQVIHAGEGDAPEGTVDYEACLARSDAIPDADRGGADVAGIFYTGGTTGLAKGVTLTHDNIMSNAMNALAVLDTTGDHWRYLHAAPMFHIADGSTNCTVTMLGSTHVFIPKFEPEATLAAIEAHRVTHTVLVPTMVGMLIQLPGVERYDLSSLEIIYYGASPMPAAVLAKAMEVFPACEFVQGYGMTETSPVISILGGKHHTFEGPNAGRIASGGQPVPSIEVRIVDEEDREVPRGTVGEIVTRGPHVMKGYWNKPEETARALRNGWMHTGDAGYMDEDGFIYIVDRVKDMIITGGENVYSVEVEDAIHQHPAIAMCAVFGIPNDEWGEAVHAVVVPNEDQTLTAEELIAHCKERIAHYKCPVSVEVRAEPLPLSGAGKVLKRDLRAPFWEGQSRQVH